MTTMEDGESSSDYYTLGQQVSLTIGTSLAAALSIAGSTAIVYVIYADHRRKKASHNVKNRLLLGLCLSDILNSLVYVFWSLAIPEGTTSVWGAKGNEQTCVAQGFLGQMALSGPFYNGALSIYFMLVIRGGMKDGEIAKKYELWWHLVAIIWPLGTAFAAYFLDLYAFIYLGCWIGQTPLDCQSDNEVECIRGENAFLYGWFFMGFPLVIINGVIVYCMIQIYRYIRSVARTQEQYDFERSNNLSSNMAPPSSERPHVTIQEPSAFANSSITMSSRQRRSLDLASTKREIAIQSFLYVGAFLITHICSIVLFWSITLFDMTPPPFALLFIQNIAWPLQGFFNVHIFLRPRINSLRRTHSELSYTRLVYYATFRYDEWTGRGSMIANERRASNRALVLQTTHQSQNAVLDIPSRRDIPTAQMSSSSHVSDETEYQRNSSSPTTTDTSGADVR